MPRISVILPAFNEAEHIEQVIRSISSVLDRMGYSYELIVVDDGSTDHTRERALKCCGDGRVKVVGYENNMGKGYALKYGSQFTSGEFIIFMDSDMDIQPSNLKLYLKGLEKADIAIASKRHPKSRVKRPLVRGLFSIIFHSLVRLLTGIKVSDTQVGLKAFRSESLKKIMPLLAVKKYAFDVEVLTVASLLKMKIVELPVNMELRKRFKLKHIFRMMIDLLGITYRLRIIHWYQELISRYRV